MTDAVTSLIEYFDRKRNEFYEERKASARPKIAFMSGKRALSLEKEFADRFIANIEEGLTHHAALPDSANWHGVILHLKNEIEGVGYSVDYLNYYHTFLAAFLAVSSAFAFKFHDSGAIIMAVVAAGFIIFAFTERTKQRNKVLKNKTLLNILEYYKATVQSSSK
jgi:hypothetical protein